MTQKSHETVTIEMPQGVANVLAAHLHNPLIDHSNGHTRVLDEPWVLGGLTDSLRCLPADSHPEGDTGNVPYDDLATAFDPTTEYIDIDKLEEIQNE